MSTTATIDEEPHTKGVKIAITDRNEADLFREAIRLFERVQTMKRIVVFGGATPRMGTIVPMN